jgi:hypothetical protein
MVCSDSSLVVLVFGDFEEVVRPEEGLVPRDHYGQH